MEDELDIQPWPVLEIIGRAISLLAVVNRGAIEDDETSDVFAAETDRFELSAWARTELAAYLTEQERSILNTSLGDLTEGQRDAVQYAGYAAAAVAWALRHLDTPHIAVPLGDDTMQRVLAFSASPWDRIRNLQKTVRLHSSDDLAAERERIELWYWRCHADSEAPDFIDVITEVQDAAIIPVREGDFVTDAGDRYREMSDEDKATLGFTAEAQLHALNWVCGLGTTWDATPLDV